MSKTDPTSDDNPGKSGTAEAAEKSRSSKDRPKEIGGRKGPDPTRYGDWEKGGRCIDF
jgi:hypothetical protein